MNIKFTFTPEERQSILDGLEIVLDSLVDYEKSFLDFRDECPDECTDEEIDVYLEKLETENNLCASRDIRLVAILKQQLEGLVSCEDVQIVER